MKDKVNNDNQPISIVQNLSEQDKKEQVNAREVREALKKKGKTVKHKTHVVLIVNGTEGHYSKFLGMAGMTEGDLPNARPKQPRRNNTNNPASGAPSSSTVDNN